MRAAKVYDESRGLALQLYSFSETPKIIHSLIFYVNSKILINVILISNFNLFYISVR